jgi:protein associated with RNAse G/E
VKKQYFPKDVVDQWPEIFGEVAIKAIPLDYTRSMRIIFKNGNEWNINIAAHAKTSGLDYVEMQLQELLDTYEDSIEHIDFQLDVNKVMKDAIKTTKSFLKKPNKKR